MGLNFWIGRFKYQRNFFFSDRFQNRYSYVKLNSKHFFWSDIFWYLASFALKIEKTSKIRQKTHFSACPPLFDFAAVNSIFGVESILKKFLKDLFQGFNRYFIKKLYLINKIFLHSGPKMKMLKKWPFFGEKRSIPACYRNERYKKHPVLYCPMCHGQFAAFLRSLGPKL